MTQRILSEPGLPSSKKKQKNSEGLPIFDEAKEATPAAWELFFIKYGKNILSGIIILAALIIVITKISASKRSSAEQDFATATIMAEKISQEGGDLSSVNKLVSLMDRHQDLHTKYDGLIAHYLLSHPDEQNDDLTAKPFIDNIFSRTKTNNDSLPFFQSYSQISLLVHDKEFTKALEDSHKLQKTLESKETLSTPLETLFVFNKMRIAILNQQLNNKNQEKDSWESLQGLSHWNITTSSGQGKTRGFDKLNALFHEGQVTLNHYIEERQKALQ